MTAPDVRSVQRAFEILEIFAQFRRPLSLKELRLELDCPSSSLADLLKTMSRVGCLSFDTGTKTYFPSTRLATLGDWVGQDLIPSDQRAALRDLCDKTGGTILLGTANDLEVQYLYVLEGVYAVRYGDNPHGRRPLVRSGTGWILLSEFENTAVDRIWRRSIASGLIDRQEMPLETLMEHIEFSRTNGYAAGRDCRNPKAAIVAIGLPDRPHGRRLTIGIGGATNRIEDNVDAIVTTLKTSFGSASSPARAELF